MDTPLSLYRMVYGLKAKAKAKAKAKGMGGIATALTEDSLSGANHPASMETTRTYGAFMRLLIN